jgi:hypothetical protein
MIITINAHAGIFRLHPGHTREAQSFRHRLTDLHACQAITPGVERRAGDDNVRPSFFEFSEDCRDCFVPVLMKIVIAEINRRGDLSLIMQLRVEPARRARRTFDDSHLTIRFFFAAETGKKLIDDMHDTDHSFSLFM